MYPTLVGSRKQSAQVAERLFSLSLLQHMKKSDRSLEARYIEFDGGKHVASMVFLS